MNEHTHSTATADLPVMVDRERLDRFDDSEAAHRAFVRWLAWDAPMDIRCQAHLTLIAYMPTRAVNDFAYGSGWIGSLPSQGWAARRLRTALWDVWLWSESGHRAFHRWLDDPGVICWGCVL